MVPGSCEGPAPLLPSSGRWVEVTVLTLANLVATLVRFLALRFVIGRKAVVEA